MREVNIIMILLIFVLPSLASADEYALVMSKDDSICPHMLKIYNEDLKKYGKIKYDQHEEFTSIKWEKRKYVWQFDRFPNFGTLLVSSFDVNDDGKKEVILKVGDMGKKGSPSDNIFIFDEKDIDTSKDEIVLNEEITNKALNILGGALGRAPFSGNTYGLNELPALEIWHFRGKNIPIKYFLGGWFYFHPFFYGGKYYTSMNDRDPNKEAKWEVILQSIAGNQIKDICYFIKICNCSR